MAKKNSFFDVLPSDDVTIADEKLRHDRDGIVAKQKANALFFGISDTFKFIAGTCTAIGMAIFIPTITSGVLAAKVAELGLLAGIGAAGALPGIAIIGAAALATGVAVAASYISSRNFNSANLDATEINAQHTAKYLVKELEAKAACVQQEHPENCRADGKQWQQVVRGQQSPEVGASII